YQRPFASRSPLSQVGSGSSPAPCPQPVSSPLHGERTHVAFARHESMESPAILVARAIEDSDQADRPLGADRYLDAGQTTGQALPARLEVSLFERPRSEERF